MIDVEAINVDDGKALLTDGSIVPITTHMNSTGNECGKDDAVVVVCGTSEKGFFAVEISNYETTTLH